MEINKAQTNKIILIAVTILIIGVVAAKQLLKKDPSSEKPTAIASIGPAVYLFLNEKDQDSGCQKLYSLYEDAKKNLPTNVKTGRLDVNGDQTLFKIFDVRILPAVLFVGSNGEVKERIEGEGPEVETKLKDAFKNLGTNL